VTTNPYAPFLGGREPREVIEATAGRLKVLLEALGAERVELAPAPGKWSARQILCHLADCEIVFAFRLRQALSQDDHVRFFRRRLGAGRVCRRTKLERPPDRRHTACQSG
jgi:hypothetical protein